MAEPSPGKGEWETPQGLFEVLDGEFHFTLDAAASAGNAKCERYFTRGNSGLVESWAWAHSVFVNPPYAAKELSAWVRKANYESRVHSALVVMLVPVRTDQDWWHDVLQYATEVRFIRGRVRFVGEGCGRPPFASAVVVYDGKRRRSGDVLRVRSAFFTYQDTTGWLYGDGESDACGEPTKGAGRD